MITWFALFGVLGVSGPPKMAYCIEREEDSATGKINEKTLRFTMYFEVFFAKSVENTKQTLAG